MENLFSRPMRATILAIVAVVALAGGVGLARRTWGPAKAQPQPQQQHKQPPQATGYAFSEEPEVAVEAFVAAVNAGDYGQAARFYWTAPERWRADPLIWKQTIENATHGKRVDHFEHLPKYDKRMEDAMFLTGYFWFENDSAPFQVMFDLVKKPEGWIIVSFR